MADPAPDYGKPAVWMADAAQKSEVSLTEALAGVVPEQQKLERALLGYQQFAIALRRQAGVSVLVIEKSRRIGMTYGFASDAVLHASAPKSRGGSDWLYISYSQDMTREFIDACAQWAKLFQLGAALVEEFIFKDEKPGEETRSIQAYRISFASGFEIVGMSSAPRSLRGRQGVVFIDEAAFVDNFEELMKAALALLMWGGQVVICSTHNGTDNPFNRLIQDIHAGKFKYRHFRVDFDEALRDGLYRRICHVNKKPWTAELQKQWRDSIVSDYGDAADEELFCIPAKGSGAWLSSELIERQMTEKAEGLILRWQWPKDYLTWDGGKQRAHMAERLAELDVVLAGLDKQNRHALGFDFARVADLSVVDVRAINHVLHRATGLILEMRSVPHEEQAQIIEHIWKKLPNPRGAAFDGTGAGHFVAEFMSRRHGLYDQKAERGGMIAEVRLSTDWYRVNMPKYKAAFEDGKISLPSDLLIAGDLRLVKMVQGVAQVPAIRTGTVGLKRHGDYAVAGAMSWYASLMNTAEYGYETAATSSRSGHDRFMHPNADFGNDDDNWRLPLGAQITGSL